MGGLIPAGGIPSGKERREGVFKSLGSIIWLKLTAVEGKEETLSSVVMENTSLALTGKAEVSWSAATPSLAALDGGKTIEVACSKTLSTTTPAEFFLFAPAGSMEGLSITVNFEEEAAHFKPFAKITRNSTLALERNKVLPIAWNVNGSNGGISAKGDPIRVEDGKDLLQALPLAFLHGQDHALRDAVAAPEGNADALTRTEDGRGRDGIAVGLVNGIDQALYGNFCDHARPSRQITRRLSAGTPS